MADNYLPALAILNDALRFGIDPTLENVDLLMTALGRPQDSYSSIQVAGTNGKTSTVRFIAAILRAHGKRVGLYTSPELVYYEERLEYDGKVVSRADFGRAVLTANKAVEQLISEGTLAGITEFELLTAAALWLFAQLGSQFAVLEVGLGGRWDATSVVTPDVAVVTGVDFDHTDILGDSIEEIAAEKAAIVKPGSRVVFGSGIAAAQQIFLEQAASVSADPVLIDRQPPYLKGAYAGLTFSGPSYQEANIACAIAASEAALGQPPEPELVQQALDTLVIPGRFELLRKQPPLLIDAAHNPQSARYLAKALRERDLLECREQGEASEDRRESATLKFMDTLLLGVLTDKDAEGIIKPLVPLFGQIAVTQSTSPRAIPATELAALVKRVCGRTPEVFADIPTALEALSRRGAAVVASGSITVAGEVKRVYQEAFVVQ